MFALHRSRPNLQGVRYEIVLDVIFLLLTANFQSFRLSLSVGLTIPAVIAGVAIALWLTSTTLNSSVVSTS